MAFNFPTSPTDGQIYISSGITYSWNVSVGAWLVSANNYATGGYYSGNYGVKSPDNYGDIFRIHANTLSQNVTILSGNNAIAVGPITMVGDSTTLTIQPGARVVII
jgi:hypothetical protein